jgi:hypothetical protein
VACRRHAAWTSAGARALCRTLYRARCAALACSERIGRSARPALCASDTVRRQTGSVCIEAHVSFSRTREWCRATTHRPPGPLPLQPLWREAQRAVHSALSTMPQSRRPRARGHAQPWSALMREQVLRPHKLALMAVGSSRGEPTGRYAGSTGGRGRASSTRRATAVRALRVLRVRPALTASVRRRAEDRPVPQLLEYSEYSEYGSHSLRACDGGRKTDRCHSC